MSKKEVKRMEATLEFFGPFEGTLRVNTGPFSLALWSGRAWTVEGVLGGWEHSLRHEYNLWVGGRQIVFFTVDTQGGVFEYIPNTTV